MSRSPAKLVFDGATTFEALAMPAGKMAAGPALQVLGLNPAMLDVFGTEREVHLSDRTRVLAAFDIPRARLSPRCESAWRITHRLGR